MIIREHEKTPNAGGKTFEELLEQFCKTENCVTRSVIHDIMVKRLQESKRTKVLK